MFKRIITFLVSALTLSSVSVIATAETKLLSVEEAHSQAAEGKITLVDIRTPNEWQSTGTPEHAVMLQYQREDFIEEILNKSKANPDKPIALICRSGGRSTRAAKALQDAGLNNLYNVKEGAQGWQAKELPMNPYTTD